MHPIDLPITNIRRTTLSTRPKRALLRWYVKLLFGEPAMSSDWCYEHCCEHEGYEYCCKTPQHHFMVKAWRRDKHLWTKSQWAKSQLRRTLKVLHTQGRLSEVHQQNLRHDVDFAEPKVGQQEISQWKISNQGVSNQGITEQSTSAGTAKATAVKPQAILRPKSSKASGLHWPSWWLHGAAGANLER